MAKIKDAMLLEKEARDKELLERGPEEDTIEMNVCQNCGEGTENETSVDDETYSLCDTCSDDING